MLRLPVRVVRGGFDHEQRVQQRETNQAARAHLRVEQMSFFQMDKCSGQQQEKDRCDEHRQTEQLIQPIVGSFQRIVFSVGHGQLFVQSQNILAAIHRSHRGGAGGVFGRRWSVCARA